MNKCSLLYCLWEGIQIGKSNIKLIDTVVNPLKRPLSQAPILLRETFWFLQTRRKDATRLSAVQVDPPLDFLFGADSHRPIKESRIPGVTSSVDFDFHVFLCSALFLCSWTSTVLDSIRVFAMPFVAGDVLLCWACPFWWSLPFIFPSLSRFATVYWLSDCEFKEDPFSVFHRTQD